jgi:hypothetical protein
MRWLRSRGDTPSTLLATLSSCILLCLGWWAASQSVSLQTLAGFDGMDDDELMSTIAADVGAQKVPPGLVRRKRVKRVSKVAVPV